MVKIIGFEPMLIISKTIALPLGDILNKKIFRINRIRTYDIFNKYIYLANKHL
jgi:hypothetical protein